MKNNQGVKTADRRVRKPTEDEIREREWYASMLDYHVRRNGGPQPMQLRLPL